MPFIEKEYPVEGIRLIHASLLCFQVVYLEAAQQVFQRNALVGRQLKK